MSLDVAKMKMNLRDNFENLEKSNSSSIDYKFKYYVFRIFITILN